MGSGCHQLEPVPIGVGQGAQRAWYLAGHLPLQPERLLHTPGYAAVSSIVLGSRSLSAGSAGLTQNVGCQTGFFRGLEIVMQHPGIAPLTMGTWITTKTHKHKSIPLGEGGPFVFFSGRNWDLWDFGHAGLSNDPQTP